MATPEENMQSALTRAAQAKESGNLERAARWEASAERYRKLIAIKERLAESKQKVETIKERIETIKENSKAIIIEANTSGSSTGNKVWIIPPGSGNKSTSSTVSSTPSTPGTVSSIPSTISPITQEIAKPPVKTAPVNAVLFDNGLLPIEILSDLIFEDLGGQELISIARNDTVNGQNIVYQPIKNLYNIQQQYNPNNIVYTEGTSDRYFRNFPIKFESKVPNDGTGPNQEHVYFDSSTKSLIIEAVNMQGDEQIEVQLLVNGTIYEAEL